jgi:hypothetical protein
MKPGRTLWFDGIISGGTVTIAFYPFFISYTTFSNIGETFPSPTTNSKGYPLSENCSISTLLLFGNDASSCSSTWM